MFVHQNITDPFGDRYELGGANWSENNSNISGSTSNKAIVLNGPVKIHGWIESINGNNITVTYRVTADDFDLRDWTKYTGIAIAIYYDRTIPGAGDQYAYTARYLTANYTLGPVVKDTYGNTIGGTLPPGNEAAREYTRNTIRSSITNVVADIVSKCNAEYGGKRSVHQLVLNATSINNMHFASAGTYTVANGVWYECDQMQIYRGSVSAAGGNEPAYAYVSKSYNTNAAYTAIANAAPYYDITTARWSVVGTTDSKNLGTLSLPNNTTKSTNTLTVDMTGKNSYSVKISETNQGRGYKRADTDSAKTVTLTPGNTSYVSFTNNPVYDPNGIVLQKAVKTGTNTTSTSATISLQGAIYKITYKPLQANGTSVGSVSRTWYYATDTNGRIDIRSAKTASGYTSSALFINPTDSNKYVWPVGDYTITEEKAPTGYVKSSDIFVVKVRENGGNISTAATKNGVTIAIPSATNAITTPEDVVSAKFTATKTNALSSTFENSGNSKLNTAKYTLFVDYDKLSAAQRTSLFTPDVGNSKKLTISSTAETWNGNSNLHAVLYDGKRVTMSPDATGKMTTDMYLPYAPNDTYVICETSAATGFAIDPVNHSIDFGNVANHGTVSAGNSVEYPLYDGFALYKKDAENESAQGDATLNGIKFVVVNESDSWVRVNEHMNELVGFTTAQVKLRNDGQTATPKVNKGEVVAILTSHTHNDQEGYIGMAGLPYGKYTVYEISNSYNVKIGDKYSSTNDGKSANNSYIFKPFSKAYDLTEQVWPTNLHSTEANYRTYMSTSATAANKNTAQLAISNAGIAAHTTKYDSTENPTNYSYRDGLSLIKKDDFYTDGSYNGNADFNDIKFAVINRSAHGVVLLNEYNTIEKSKVDISNGKLIEPNQIAAIITTHDATVDGKAIHGYAAMYGLPYGKYEVVELRRDNKYVVGDVYNTSNTAKNGSSIYANSTYFWANNTHTFTLHDGKDHASAAAAVAAHSNVMVISNKATIDGFAIYKKDVTFDKNNIKHEQGDASFNDIKFAVVNESDNHVTLDINDIKQTPNYSANNITISDGKSIAPNHVVAIVTTHTNDNMSGYAAMYGLPYGKYRLYELRKDSTITVDSTVDQIKADNKNSIYANDSYLLDAEQTIALDLTDRETATSDLHPTTAAGCIEKHTIAKAFTDTVVSADITITKFDAETGLTGEDGNQGVNTFAGIRYAIVNSSKQSMVYPANSTKPEDEYAVGQIVTVVTLDETGTTTVKDLAYGTYTIYELRMDSTFKAHDVYNATSEKAGTSEFANAYYIYCDSNRKVTLNETERKPDHQAKFTYTVDSKTQSVRLEDENYDENYNNLPVRGDFNTIKVDIDGRYMSNIPFLVSLVETDKDGNVIFDEETGAPKNIIEEHIIVTNSEGKLDTSDWITRPKTKDNVNKLDGKYNSNGWFTGTDAELTAAQTQNIWFGRISETHDEYVRNGRGSMLYGTYYVQELKTSATKQYDMITATVTIDENAVTVYPNDSEILINIPYFIESVAMDTVTKTNAMRLSKESIVKDTVTFMNLKKNNKYAYKSKVYRVDKTGTSYLLKTTDLKEISPAGYDDLNYTPKTVDVNEITFDSTTLQKGEKITIVTELYKIVGKNWVLQFDHNTELTDDNETVVVPEIKTKAVNTTTRTRVGSLTPYTVPDDKIEYWNFASNHPYVIDFKIVDDEGNLVKDINGKNCTTSIQFYADAEATEVKESSRYAIAGTEFVTFRGPSEHGVFNFSDLNLNNSFEVANDYKNIYFVTEVHDTAIDDATNNIITSDNTARDVEDETIRYLQIGTVASSADYLEGIIPNAKVVDLIDKINYENLAENIKVRVDGTVVEKESKDVVTTASKEFNLTGKKGTRELKFTFDSTPYAGKDLVVFEKIYMVIDGKDVLIADHSDINDTKQTVNVPDIKTNFVNVHKGTGYKVVSQVIKDITLEDTVTYKNVLPGKSWTLKATLMDKNTNAPVKDANGNTVTGTVTFTPETEDGSIVVPVTFKQVITAQDWEIDESWVCFETLKSNENGHKELEYAVHNDIEDKDQTVYKPKFRTTATAENGSKQILAKPDQKIVDKVELKNFDKAVETGDTFTLLIEAMDAKTGEKLLKADGTPYTNTKTFVWNGQTEENIDIVIDASKLEGKVITFFETLYFGNEVAEGSEVLRENAIDNAEQSITVPMVRTTAVDSETRTKTVSLKRLLVDKIDLTYITPDTDYVIYTKLVDKATGEFIKTTDGEDLVVRSTYHSPKDSEGAIACDGCSMHTDRKVFAVNDTINVDIDVSKIADLEGKDLVVYEYLRLVTNYDEETGNTTEEEYANHEDINDEGQTVEIPKIGTTATSVDTKEHVVPVNEEIELVDVVEYSNLIKGETYTVRGKLYNKETGEPITIDDKEITASTTFTAEAEEGTVEIKFTFNSKILEGTTLVAFEDCSWNNIDIATHSDIEDEGQTVDIPKLKTTFFDVVNEKAVEEGKENSGHIGEDVTLKDVVNYTNLTPGLEYTVTGTIMDKETGEPIKINDKEVTASTTFTPEDRTGSVEVVFEHIDTSKLAGKTTVAFETLDYKDVEITIHADLEDKDQTVKFPEISTELIDDKTGDHMVAEGVVTITDIISYKNLVPGKTYTLVGDLVFATENNPVELVSKDAETNDESKEVEDTNAEDKSEGTDDVTDAEGTDTTEDEVATAGDATPVKTYNHNYESAPEKVMYNGEAVTNSVTFVASESGEGEVKVQFTIDSRELKGRTLVAFETLMQNDAVLLVDNDITNENETVHVPEVHTTAKDKADNDNVIDGTKTEQTIVDTVTYKNLIPGKTYKATGKLVVKKDYKEGEEFEYVKDAEGNILTSTVEFTAENYDGTVDVEFTFDASKYAGKKLVAFESVSYEDVEFATHADIEDEEQTVEVSLLLHVKVAKVDADNIKYTLEGAEITIFNEDGTIAKDIDGKDCVGITDANGEVNFTVLYREDNTYYAQETKAPAGYNINNDKFEIVATEERESEGVCLIPIQIKDKVIIIPPQTGDNIPVMPIALSFGGGLACLAVFFLTKKKKSEMVEAETENNDNK